MEDLEKIIRDDIPDENTFTNGLQGSPRSILRRLVALFRQFKKVSYFYIIYDIN